MSENKNWRTLLRRVLIQLRQMTEMLIKPCCSKVWLTSTDSYSFLIEQEGTMLMENNYCRFKLRPMCGMCTGGNSRMHPEHQPSGSQMGVRMPLGVSKGATRGTRTFLLMKFYHWNKITEGTFLIIVFMTTVKEHLIDKILPKAYFTSKRLRTTALSYSAAIKRKTLHYLPGTQHTFSLTGKTFVCAGRII